MHRRQEDALDGIVWILTERARLFDTENRRPLLRVCRDVLTDIITELENEDGLG